MQKIKNKTMAILIIALLAISISASLILLPATKAHNPPWNIATVAYVNVSPNPVGIGQTALIVMWIENLNPSANGITGDRWQNYTLKITAPDGTTTSLGPYTAGPTSATDYPFVPDQLGTYNVNFNFGGQTARLANPINGLNGTSDPYIGDYYMPSSASINFVVQQEPVQGPIGYPLPTEYWSRPVNSQLSSWGALLSNWLYTPPSVVINLQPSGPGPLTSHIMWTQPVQFGGVVGGAYTSGATKFGSYQGGSYTFYEGMSYEERNISPIIMGGYLYYELPLSHQATGGGYVCVDLRTGQQLWKQNYTVNPTFGQLYGYDSINQHGVLPNGWLWAVSGTTWIAYDGMTGNWLFNLTNVPTGTLRYGTTGEIVKYQLDPNGKWLADWNNTAGYYNGTNVNQVGEFLDVGSGANALQWRTVGKVINMTAAYSWNKTLSTPVTPGSTIIDAVPDDLVLVSTVTSAGSRGVSNTPLAYGLTLPYNVSAISLAPDTLGQVLWTKNYPGIPSNITRLYYGLDPSTNIYMMYDKETFQVWGYSLLTGEQVWGPFTMDRGTNWQLFQAALTNQGVATNGILVTTGWGGVTYGVDDTNGKLLWTYGNGPIGSDNSTNSGTIAPYGNYPTFIGAVVGGTAILFNSEHSPIEPPQQGEMIRCINITTGEQIWALNAWPVSTSFYSQIGAVAEGFLTFFNEYDGQMYSVGRGPSATTVSAPDIALPMGTPIVIKGTVRDVSAGAQQATIKADYPNGLPVASDASMGSWMSHVYQQFPLPTNFTGVPVAIDVLDSNGNYRNIGTATTDASGTFSLLWTPDITGSYTVVANFAGTNGYWGSSSQNAFYITEAATPTTQPTAAPASIVETYFLPAVIAIIAVIIIGFALLFLALRKRP
jgi:hypothetical protein